MTFNKLIRITEHPTKADTSAPTDDRIILLICINWALQNYFYEGVLPQSSCHGHPQGAPHHATPPLSLRYRTSDTRLVVEPSLLSSLEIGFIIIGAHEAIKLGRIAYLHDQHPTIIIGLVVDKLRLILQGFIHLHYLSTDWRNEFRGCLDRFDITELPIMCYARTCIPWQFDIDDVTKLILGIIGNADGCLVALDAYPFVRFAIFEICRMI